MKADKDKKRAVAGLFLAAVCAACSKPPDTSPSPTISPATTTEIMVGTLAVQQSSVFAFNVAASGTVAVTLASVTAGTPPQPTGTPLGLGVGTPDGAGCTLSSSSTVRAALTAQISTSLSTGARCVQLFDPGTLTGPVDFAIRVVHP